MMVALRFVLLSVRYAILACCVWIWVSSWPTAAFVVVKYAVKDSSIGSAADVISNTSSRVGAELADCLGEGWVLFVFEIAEATSLNAVSSSSHCWYRPK